MADITQINNNDSSISAYAPQKPCTVLGNKVSVVLGAQYGDEGKGKFTDLLATDADIVCRCAVSKFLCFTKLIKYVVCNIKGGTV